MADDGFSVSSLLDTDNIGDFINDGMGLVKNVFSGFFDSNSFSGVGEYPAVVISNPTTISPSEYAALGYENYDGQSDRNYKKFKVRIINKRNNPHILLEDPCDLSVAQELCQQNALIASHTTIVTNRSMGIGIGSLVRIHLDKLPNKTYNLQTGHLKSLEQKNETGATVLSKLACDSMATMFEFGENYDPPPTVTIDSDTFYWAQKYDEDPNVPKKRQHIDILEGLFDRGNGFDLYVKTFIYLVWKTHGYSITLNSGYRTQAEQTKLYNKYMARKAANPGNPEKWGLPAVKNPGYHGTGMAIDFNFNTEGQTLPTGETGDIGSKALHPGQDNAANKMMWEQSGVVKVATDMGLVWGGNFRSGYDPIHIQWLPSDWTHNDVIMHANNPTKAAVSTTPKGSGIGNEYEASNKANLVSDANSEIASFPSELINAANLETDLNKAASVEPGELNLFTPPEPLNDLTDQVPNEDYSSAAEEEAENDKGIIETVGSGIQTGVLNTFHALTGGSLK